MNRIATILTAILLFGYIDSAQAQAPALKLDARFEGGEFDYLHSVQQTSDGGYILGGSSYSGISGDKTQASQGYYDHWMAKAEPECQPGTFINDQTNQCDDCPPGFYQPLAGQFECIPCPQGTFNAQTGQTQCQPCEAGFFNDQLGAIECQPCPTGTTSDQGGIICEPVCEYEWVTGAYTDCSAPCGGGVQTRTVQCIDCNGVVVADGFCTTTEPATQQLCNEHPCPVDCMVSEWLDWGICSATCGEGMRCRIRTVIALPQFGGEACPALEECEACNLPPCPVNCEVSAWSDWSSCSVPCGGGTQSRKRTVIVQPQFGGALCPELEEYQACNTQACCENSWLTGSYTACSAPCGGGVQTRTVQCIDCNGVVVADGFCTTTKPATQQLCNEHPCPCLLTVDAGSPQTVYPGYSPQSCVTLTSNVTSGNGTLTYAWSTGASGNAITVCPNENTTYCVTVTDTSNCTAEACVEVCAVNVSCSNNPQNTKVLLCKKNKLICVSINAVNAQLGNGATLGPCNLPPCGQSAKMSQDMNYEAFTGYASEVLIKSYPNPFSRQLNFEFILPEDSRVRLEVFNISGQQLAIIFEGDLKADEMYLFEYMPDAYLTNGILVYRLQTEQGAYYGKAVLVR